MAPPSVLLPVEPRRPFPSARFHLFAALAATGMAVVASVIAVSVRALPPVSSSIVLIAAAPMSATVAALVLGVRASRERDLPLRWFTAGLVVAVVAMLLQLPTFPAVMGGGGPLHTGGDASAALYLAMHLALAAGALAGAARLAHRWVVPAAVTGVVLVVALATDLLPLPDLLTSEQAFTALLVSVEWGIVATTIAALVAWAATEGAVSTPLRGWVGVCLAIAASDIALNALAERRYDALWWSSLTMRTASFTVLAVGALIAVLRELDRLEDYSDNELARRESQLVASIGVTERLLDNARALAASATPAQVVDSLTAAAAAVADVPRVLLFGVEDDGRLAILGGRGYDPDSWGAVQQLTLQGLPANDVARSGEPVYVSGHDPLLQHYPALSSVGVHRTSTQRLAAVPLRVGDRVAGVLAVTGDRPQPWSAAERELLAGLAAQGGQALERARLYERERSAAEQLQHALLPRQLPTRADVELAARYLAGVQGVSVGGDWYDCLECDERLALVVGDVMGMGLEAAALMGRLRTATRVLASLDPSPVAVLQGLDEVIAGLDDGEVFATVVYVLLDLEAGTAEIARAGHVPPLLLTDAGAAFVSAGGSLPLGGPVGPRVSATVPVPPGSTVLLYSDGLVEWHPDGVAAGLEELRVGFESSAARCPRPDDIAAAVLAHAPEPRPDDIAVLVARLVTR
jgi:hypothetical protein